MKGGEKWDIKLTIAMIVDNRSSPTSQTLPCMYSFEGTVRRCPLNYLGVKLENYRAVKMQEAVVKMQEEQQEAEKMGMLQ
jgi:hypothetical protein